MSISASEARSWLFPLLKRVNEDHDVVRINSRQHGDAVLMSADDWRSWQETVYLLRSPANTARLLEAVARDQDESEAVAATADELIALAEDE
ncbi:type II toxin-antitoxin system Phd/YefM family antitoxin [Nocardiopsis lucentensis]|uniref:type II toxin-antitoxin system Phd/YefM family antitoxin n=1 Tax=Nocardiopsis lucentensis TaxID=53441 RepID=UPI000348EC96|nr:type II toxin-antitoxin system Phd/YefM family antitoxin [Nocardiopsis lucentensis]